MASKRGFGVAAVGGGLVVVLMGIAHSLGTFVDDAGRAGGRVLDPPPVIIPKAPHIPPAIYDVLNDPAVHDSVKEGASAFRQLRNGDDSERVLVSVACSGFDAFASEQASQQRYEQYLTVNAPPEVPAFVVDRYKSTLATGMYAAQVNGGLSKWYFQYCVFKAK